MSKSFKYDYYQVVLPNWIDLDPINRQNWCDTSTEYVKAIKPYIDEHKQRKFPWQKEWETHTEDGSYTRELIEYLQQNAEFLKIWGYGYPAETIQIWNRKESMYAVVDSRIVLSRKFKDYLIAEGYHQMAIDGIEYDVHKDAFRYWRKMSLENAVEAMMEADRRGFENPSPESGTILEWKVSRREQTLIEAKMIKKTVYRRIFQ